MDREIERRYHYGFSLSRRINLHDLTRDLGDLCRSYDGRGISIELKTGTDSCDVILKGAGKTAVEAEQELEKRKPTYIENRTPVKVDLSILKF